MYIACDKERCIGCLACVTACIAQHYDITQEDVTAPRIYEWTQGKGKNPTQYMTRSCYHCQEAKCMEACQFHALYRDERGFIQLDGQHCVGCKQCQSACPHGVPRFSTEGKMVKCDGCSVRIACALKPACVAACPVDALTMKQEKERLN